MPRCRKKVHGTAGRRGAPSGGRSETGWLPGPPLAGLRAQPNFYHTQAMGHRPQQFSSVHFRPAVSVCCFVLLCAQCSAAGDGRSSVCIGLLCADSTWRRASKTDDEFGTPSASLRVGSRSDPTALTTVIEPARSVLVAQLESYGGKTYGRLADPILAVAALFVAHLVVWYFVYARHQFNLADDGELSVTQSKPASESASR